MYQTLSRRLEAIESGKKEAEIKMEVNLKQHELQSSQKIAEFERRLIEATLAKGSGADDEVQHRLQRKSDIGDKPMR